MAAQRRPSDDSPDECGSKVENGFYRIVRVQGEEREFDWVPKNPSVDPPTGQYRLSESAREAYSWCVDYIDDQTQETYDGFLDRLRDIVFGGLVDEPIGPDAAKRMNELRADLLSYAKRKLGPIKTKAVELRIRIAIVLYLAGLALAWAGGSHIGVFGNWILFAGSAVSATAVLTWYDEVKDLGDYPIIKSKLDAHSFDLAISLILVLGVGYVIQSKWITLAMGGKPIEIAESTVGAGAIGFTLGLLSDKLLQLLQPFLDRVSRAMSNGPQTARRLPPRNG